MKSTVPVERILVVRQNNTTRKVANSAHFFCPDILHALNARRLWGSKTTWQPFPKIAHCFQNSLCAGSLSLLGTSKVKVKKTALFFFKAEIWEVCNLALKFLISKCDWTSQHCQSYIQKKLVRICYDDQIFVAKVLSIHTAQETKKKRLQVAPGWTAQLEYVFFPENIRYLLSDRNLYFSLTKLLNRNCGYSTGIRQLR